MSITHSSKFAEVGTILRAVLIYSHEVGMSKPDARIYALACERLNVQPGEMVFLDDIEPYIAGAQACGIHTVLFKDNAQAIAEIDRLIHANDGNM